MFKSRLIHVAHTVNKEFLSWERNIELLRTNSAVFPLPYLSAAAAAARSKIIVLEQKKKKCCECFEVD